MRRLFADLFAVLLDLLPVAAAAIAAACVVLIGGMAVHVQAGRTAGAVFVNEGLVFLVIGLVGWLVLIGRHRYEQRGGGRR